MHTEDSIRCILIENDKAVERAMVVLYERQTNDEQEAKDTRHVNGRGFNSADARLGSYYAKWVQSGKRLTGNHLNKARIMSMKYARQLVEAAEEKSARNAIIAVKTIPVLAAHIIDAEFIDEREAIVEYS